MTDTDIAALVERLRQIGDWVEPKVWEGDAVAFAAADALEVMQARAEKAKAEIERLRGALTIVPGTVTEEEHQWAINVIAEHARADTLEEAAKVVDDEDGEYSWAGEDRNVALLQEHSRELAAAIRALKENLP